MNHSDEAIDQGQHGARLQEAQLSLQSRFLRTFAWLRKLAGMTQRELAEAAGWQQPYVARLEDERSPLIMGLSRLERYADACGATGVLVFIDKQTGQVRRTLALGDAGVDAAERLREGGAIAERGTVQIDTTHGTEVFTAEAAVTVRSRTRQAAWSASDLDIT